MATTKRPRGSELIQVLKQQQTELPFEQLAQRDNVLDALDALRVRVLELCGSDEPPPCTSLIKFARRALPTTPIEVKRLRIQYVLRSGTHEVPYEKRNGTRTIKVSFCASDAFARREKRFFADLPPRSRGAWIEAVLSRAMDAWERDNGPLEGAAE